jgi:hypothetical protein
MHFQHGGPGDGILGFIPSTRINNNAFPITASHPNSANSAGRSSKRCSGLFNFKARSIGWDAVNFHSRQKRITSFLEDYSTTTSTTTTSPRNNIPSPRSDPTLENKIGSDSNQGDPMQLLTTSNF